MFEVQIYIKQKTFIDLYLTYFNASKASLEAGYATDSEGRKLLRNPTVKKAIFEKMNEIAEKASISRSAIVSELFDTYGEARRLGQLKVAISALDSICRISGYNQDKLSIDGNVKVERLEDHLHRIKEENQPKIIDAEVKEPLTVEDLPEVE